MGGRDSVFAGWPSPLVVDGAKGEGMPAAGAVAGGGCGVKPREGASGSGVSAGGAGTGVTRLKGEEAGRGGAEGASIR